MGGFRPPPQHRRERVAHRPDVPAPDPASLGGLDRDDLARGREDDLGNAVEVDVLHADAVDCLAGRAGRAVGEVLGRDQVLVRGQAHVADVDAPEEAVPVAVVRLALVEMVEGGHLQRPVRHRRDLGRRPQHLLVEVVDLAILHLEVAPEPAPQVAVLGSAGRLGPVDEGGEDPALLGRQRPLAHLGVRRGRQVDPADRRVAVQPVRRRDRREPVGVRLERVEEAVHPAVRPPAVLPGGGPAAELLAVVAHHADPLALLGGMVPQVGDDVVHAAEGDPVAEALLGAEDREEVSLVVRRVGTPEALLGDGRRPEVVVVEDRPAVAGRDEGGREVRLPDPLREPRAPRPPPGDALQLVGHPRQLAQPVPLGQRRQHGLVVATAEQLDLAALDDGAEALQELRPLGAHPVQERSRVVEGEAHPGVAVQGVDHRPVGLVVDVRPGPSRSCRPAGGCGARGRARCAGPRVLPGTGVGLGPGVRLAAVGRVSPPQPASVTTRRLAVAPESSMPAAGR